MSAGASPDGESVASEVAVPASHQRHSVVRNLIAMMSSQAGSWLLGLVAQIVQPRFLGPDGLGQIQLAFALWIVAQVFVTMGTGTYLTLEMARDRERGVTLVGPILVLRIGAFAVASLALFGYAWIVGYDRDLMLLLAITGVSMLVNTLQDVFMSAIIGLEQMTYVSVTTVTSKLLYTILMVVVLVNGGGVIELAYTTMVQAVVGIGMIGFFYRRMEPIRFSAPARGYRYVVRASAGFMAAGVIVTLYMQIDMAVMSLLVDDDPLGWYTSADVLISSMLFIPTLILTVLFPVFGRLHAVDKAAIERLVHRAFWILILSGISVGFGLAVVAEPFSVLLFGEDFRETGDVLAVFGMTLPLIFVTMLLGQVCLTSGREGFWNRLMGVAVVISVAFDIVFVPIMDRAVGNGAVAGAMGYVVTESMMVVVALRRITPELLSSASLAKIAKTVTAGGLMFVTAWQFRDMFLPIPIAIGAIVFVAAVVGFRVLSDDDRQLVAQLGARFGIRWNRGAAAAVPADVEVEIPAGDLGDGTPDLDDP